MTTSSWSAGDFISDSELGVGDKIPCGYTITEITERKNDYKIKLEGWIEANNDWVDDEEVKINMIASKTPEEA